MCGICGVIPFDIKKKPDLSTVQAMNRVLKHRGPDQENIYLEEGVGLGHQRLKVIDLVSGDQPMLEESRKTVIVFNGEIYNFQELRSQLEKRGVSLKTQSDTEVLLHLYRKKGKAMLEDLRGMFAFAIWDHEKKELFCARDRVGKKPFFYSLWNQGFYFGSEIKALLQVPGFPRELNRESVQAYFGLTYIPYPQTAFEGVFELPPAHFLVFKGGEIKVERYWQVSFEQKSELSESEACESLWEVLKEATRIRMISDVPLGAFLSGGIDSSAIVALMSELSSRPVKTFSIGFEEATHNELPYARQIAEKFGTDHEEFKVRPNALEVLPKLVWHYDQPFADASALPSLYVSQMARQRVTVALNGDGGDESFCGYPRYQQLLNWQKIEKIPFPIRQALSCLGGFGKEGRSDQGMARFFRMMRSLPQSTFDRYLRHMIQFTESERSDLLNPDYVEKEKESPEVFLKKMYDSGTFKQGFDGYLALEFQSYLPCDLLVKMDRASMAYGLETRSPFLDHKLIEFAATLPFSYKLRGKTLKYLLKKMLRGRLPDEILDRPKAGFGVPLKKWFREDLAETIREVLLDAKTKSRPYFKSQTVETLIEEHQQGKANHGHRLWSLLFFELWHRKFLDQVPQDE